MYVVDDDEFPLPFSFQNPAPTTDLWIDWIIYWIYLNVYFWSTTPPFLD